MVLAFAVWTCRRARPPPDPRSLSDPTRYTQRPTVAGSRVSWNRCARLRSKSAFTGVPLFSGPGARRRKVGTVLRNVIVTKLPLVRVCGAIGATVHLGDAILNITRAQRRCTPMVLAVVVVVNVVLRLRLIAVVLVCDPWGGTRPNVARAVEVSEQDAGELLRASNNEQHCAKRSHRSSIENVATRVGGALASLDGFRTRSCWGRAGRGCALEPFQRRLSPRGRH
jgi:hypothetical protein